MTLDNRMRSISQLAGASHGVAEKGKMCIMTSVLAPPSLPEVA